MTGFLAGASARAARAAGSIFAKASDGWADGTAFDDMSGAGAGVVVRAPAVFGCQGSGRPTRVLVTIGGEPLSSVASATNSNATSDQTDHCKKGESWHCCAPLAPPQHSEE